MYYTFLPHSLSKYHFQQSDQFQPDLYPDTVSPTPALTSEEWFSGLTRGPVLMSLKTG